MSKGCWLFFMPLIILVRKLRHIISLLNLIKLILNFKVQGGVYLWLSIWGLILRECDQQITDIAKQPFQYVMDLIYFYGNLLKIIFLH